MPAVARRLRRARDRGAVATVVAVLLAFGVLLGFAAIVIDVGMLYAEREELITGADAGALAVGRACANDRPDCANEASIVSLVSTYANANASDNLSNVLEVCGRLPGKLAACSAGPDNLTQCLGDPPPSPTEFVEVRLSTLLSGGRLLLPPAFAQTMMGNEGYDGTAVRACARVTWERISVLGLTVSTCEAEDAPVGGPEPYIAADEYVIQFVAGRHDDCAPLHAAPWHTPGEAGFLDSDGRCRIDMPDDGEVWGDDLDDPRFEPPRRCADALDTLISSGQAVWVPVHDAHQHRFGRTGYRNVRVAKFVVTGYYFGDDRDERRRSGITGDLPCESD
jgi:hypothetical protein